MTTDTEHGIDAAAISPPDTVTPQRDSRGHFLPKNLDDTRPKRKAGRPPGSKNKAKKTPVRQAPKPKAITRWDKIIGMLVLARGVSQLALDPEDVLTDDELRLLADAIDAECAAYPALEKWLDAAGKVSPHLQLLEAVIVIAIPRMQRRGKVPDGTAELTRDMAAGRAHGLDRRDGEREIDAGGMAPVGSAIPDSSSY